MYETDTKVVWLEPEPGHCGLCDSQPVHQYLDTPEGAMWLEWAARWKEAHPSPGEIAAGRQASTSRYPAKPVGMTERDYDVAIGDMDDRQDYKPRLSL